MGFTIRFCNDGGIEFNNLRVSNGIDRLSPGPALCGAFFTLLVLCRMDMFIHLTNFGLKQGLKNALQPFFGPVFWL
jgi:hypothetical protein